MPLSVVEVVIACVLADELATSVVPCLNVYVIVPLLAVAHVSVTTVPLSIVASEGLADKVGVWGITETGNIDVKH